MDSTKDPIREAKNGALKYFEGVELDVIQNARDADGISVLNWAVINNHLRCCDVIYRRCPQLLYETTSNGNCPLHNAAYNGREEIIKYLLTCRAKLEHEAQSSSGGEVVDYRLLMMLTESNETALHYAVRRGHLGSAKILIEADRSNKLLGMLTVYNRTAMHWAVECHEIGAVKLLLEADPDFQYSTDINGDTPLLIALIEATSGDQKAKAVKIRKLLIEKQPDQCRLPTGASKWTFIHHATHTGDYTAVQEIIHFWPDCCNLVDTEMQNFLHLAAKFDEVNLVKNILEQNTLAVDVLNGKDVFGNTPLHLAILNGHSGITLSLLNDPRVDKMIENMEGKRALDLASGVFLGDLIKDKYPVQYASKGDTGFLRTIQVDVLQNCIDENGESVLFAAVRNDHLNCCEVICERCPNLLYQKNKNELSVLHTAAYNGKDNIIKFLLGALEKVDYTLLMMVSNNQQTALHFAVDRDHFESAKLLILADSSNTLLQMTDSCEETAMHYAVKRHNLNIVKILIQADPDFEYSANDSGNTPLSIALQEATTSVDQKTVEIRKLLIQKLAKQCKVRIGTNGWTLLHHATVNGDSSAVKEIIQFCPDCSELVDNEERNFLHLAAMFEHEHVVKLILNFSFTNDDIWNRQDVNGDTPFHIAASKGSENMTKLLLYDSRVNKMIQNKQGKNVLDAIRFKYDKRKAGVLGLISGVDEEDLKEQSSFDLVVGALISTVSFTAGITVPGGFISDDRRKGTAILLKKGTFVGFVAANTIALALSLLAVFIHFCLKDVVDEKEISFQLKVAAISSIGSIFALMVAFIMGSLAVLSPSLLLVCIVCGICSIFFGCAFYLWWRTRRTQKRRRYNA